MNWTPAIERRLLELGDVTAPQAAATLSSEFGLAFTEDQVRNKRKRLIAQGENVAAAANSGVDPRYVLPAAPEYVGPTIAFWDLETTFGSNNRLLAAAIADGFGAVVSWDARLFPDNCDRCPPDKCDRQMALEIRDELEWYTILAGWNSKLFDVPVLNARLRLHGERPLAAQMHIDLMYYATGQFLRIGRKSLENVSKFFRSPHSKTPLLPEIWDRADHGNDADFDLIVEHNVADVLVTRDVYAHLAPFIRTIHRAG